MTRTIDTVLAIYQGGSLSSTIKNLTGRTSQEIRETLEQLIQQYQNNDSSTPQQTQFVETHKQTPLIPQVPPTTPASVIPQQQQQQQQQSNNNDGKTLFLLNENNCRFIFSDGTIIKSYSFGSDKSK